MSFFSFILCPFRSFCRQLSFFSLYYSYIKHLFYRLRTNIFCCNRKYSFHTNTHSFQSCCLFFCFIFFTICFGCVSFCCILLVDSLFTLFFVYVMGTLLVCCIVVVFVLFFSFLIFLFASCLWYGM